MAENETKYFSVFNNGIEDFHVKDAEARAAIEQLDPASVIEVSDITALTSTQLDSLLVGSRVNKITGNEKHGYTVVYKDATKGEISLVYNDASNSEEVYYEKVEGTWTYIETTYARLSKISEKADKVSGSSLNNHLAALNSNGNLKDSGKSIDDIKPFATTSICQEIITELS